MAGRRRGTWSTAFRDVTSSSRGCEVCLKIIGPCSGNSATRRSNVSLAVNLETNAPLALPTRTEIAQNDHQSICGVPSTVSGFRLAQPVLHR
jgi:hypothetical protein